MTLIGQKVKGSFLAGVVFAKGCTFLLGRGLGSGSGGRLGLLFLLKMRERGNGVGRVGGGDRPSCAR